MSELRPTKKQRELLDYISSFITQHGYGPSYREVMRALGYKSVSTVAAHINNLISKGYLRKRTNSARSLEVVNESPVAGDRTKTLPANDKHWFIEAVSSKFAEVERLTARNVKAVDELYVLASALQIVGLEEAALSAKARLLALEEKFAQ